MAGGGATVEDLLAALEETTALLPASPVVDTMTVREFLAGPPVVRVTGQRHPERAGVAGWLDSVIPAARVVDADLARPDPEPLWDVSVVVTPANMALSQAEKEFIQVAAAERRPVLVVISRLSVFGDEQGQARDELESFTLVPVLRQRSIPWFYLPASPQDYDAALAQQVVAVAAREGGHDRAVRAYLRHAVDDLIAAAAGLRKARRAEEEKLAALRARLSAHQASLREAVRTRALAAIDRLRVGEEGVYQAVDELVSMTRAWLDGGGLIPWPDVEHSVRRAVTELATSAQRLGPSFEEAIRGDFGRITSLLDGGLSDLGLPPAGLSDAPISWSSPALASAMARVASASPDLVLSAVEKRLRDYLEAQLKPTSDSDTSGSGSTPPDDSDQSHNADQSGEDGGDGFYIRQRWVDATVGAVRKAIDDIWDQTGAGSADEDRLRDEVRGMLVQFLDAYLRPRVRDVASHAKTALPQGGQAALDDTVAAIDRALDHAEAELAERYAWSDAYARLVALRAEIG